MGNVIRLTTGGQAKIEQKPEVRKAGGVYYTPTYIVDYIVKNTVGKLLEGKTPQEVAGCTETWKPAKNGKPLSVLDPACGSGSFLLVAYQYLLDWHLNEYANSPKKYSGGKEPKIYEHHKGGWRLTTAERKRILLANIYGVDIDAQAVEVTKLSLLLKVLEGETAQTVQSYLGFYHRHALPDLANNIKCGNSVVSSDFFNLFELELEQLQKVNPFNWGHGFREIMSTGGFDIVIGNPPYVFGRDWKALGIPHELKEYFSRTFRTSPYQLDMFSIFMEHAFNLTKAGGRVGQIVPNVWLTNTHSSAMRSFYLSNAAQLTLVVPPSNVFPGITVDTIVYVLRKGPNQSRTFGIVKLAKGGTDIPVLTLATDDYRDGRPISTASTVEAEQLVHRLSSRLPRIGTIARITRGVHPYRLGGYGQSAFETGPQTERDLKERPYHSPQQKKGYRPFIYGRDLKRYTKPCASEFIKYGPWIAEPRHPHFFEGKRIYSRKILSDRLVVTLEEGDSVADQQVYITKIDTNDITTEFVLAILGSKLIAFYIRSCYDEDTTTFPQIKVSQLRSLPIALAGSGKDFRRLHDSISKLGSTLLDLKARLQKSSTTHERNLIQRQISLTEVETDRLVYELYGLTEAEIQIVEQGIRTADVATEEVNT